MPVLSIEIKNDSIFGEKNKMTFLDKAIYEDYIETIFVQAKLKIVVKAFGLLSRLLSFSSLHRLALVKAMN